MAPECATRRDEPALLQYSRNAVAAMPAARAKYECEYIRITTNVGA